MKLVDALTIALRDWGVGYVFGVSGANIEHLHDGIVRLGAEGERPLRSVLAKSEVGAAFMADGRARVHRTLGVCCATSGGGMMNLAVGIAEAYAESVPLLAIVGQVPAALEGRGGFQDSSGIGRSVDAEGLFASIAKHVARVTPERFWDQVAHAVTAALSGRQGPAVLLIARDAYEREVPPKPSWFPTDLDVLARPASVAKGAIEPLFQAIRDAKRPVILAGTGLRRSRDGNDAVTAFARAARVPVVTTMGDPGAFPNDDPLWLGVVGAAGHPSAHAYLASHADRIVAVGAGLNALTRQPIAAGFAHARVAAVNVDAGELRRAVDADIVVEADAGEAFHAMNARWDEAPFAKARVEHLVTRIAPARSPNDEFVTSEALGILEPRMPENGHILFDAGNCAASAIHYLRIPRRASSTIALGMGGMGYAIAAAVGAQLGDGARTVVMCGDGAFLMLGFEVHTAAALRLPILYVVFNDAKHGMCVTRQKLYFEGRIDATEYDAVDVAAVARGLAPADRLWVGRASSRMELRDRLAEYEASPRTGVLEIRLAADEMPPFAPFLEGQEIPTVTLGDRRILAA